MPHHFIRLPREWVATIVLTAAAFVCGCASPNGSGAPATAPSSTSASADGSTVAASARQLGQHAECLVCKENADLA